MNIKEIQEFVCVLNIPNIYEGMPELEINTFCSLTNLKDSAITWVRNIKDSENVDFGNYKDILLVANINDQRLIKDVNILWVDNPHRTFFKILEQFFSDVNPENVGCCISSSAVVETTQIGKNVYIGHQCYIGKNVSIGNNVKIHHDVSIEGKVTIGDDTVIASGTRIGICGFGHYEDFDGTNVCVPHLAGVRIGKNVRIGANTVICRGCLDDTIIEDNVRISSLCNIAHNDHIKQNAIITAGVTISGSTTVGENTWLSPGTVLNNGITVEDNSFVGLGAVATKSLDENGVYVGVPAKKLRDR